MFDARSPRIHRRARSDVYPGSPRGAVRGWQIGPRIRIGGTLGHIGQQVKEGVGKLDKAAAPFVGMIPGVGQIAAPIMNIAGHALDTSDGGLNGGNIGKVALQSAGMYGLGKLGSLLGSVPGVGGAVQSVEHMAGGLPGVSQAEGFLHDHPGVGNFLGSVKQDLLGGGQPGQPGGDQGLLGKIGSFLGGNGGLNALGTAGAVNAAMLQSKANDYAKNALGQVEQSYNERAPLRTGGMQAMQSSLAANPFSGTAMPARQAGAMPVNPTTPAQRPVTLGGY